MSRARRYGSCLLLCAAAQSSLAGGFLDDAQSSLLARNYLLHSDSRNSPGQSLRREWAQGFIASWQSGYSAGPVGVGLEAQAFAGFKLDGGRGHTGTGLLPRDSDGASANRYATAGAALKLRYAASTLRYGEMRVQTPVFATGDKRLQPEYARGALLQSDDLPGLRLQAGRFSAFRNQDGSSSHAEFSGYGASTRGAGISLIGVELGADQPAGAAFYASQLDDNWRQYYFNLHQQIHGLRLDAHYYRTHDWGQARAGRIDTQAWSLAGAYGHGAQRLTLGYQQIDGDTPFDFVGGDSIALANAIKYADFNGPGERSWQLRYDLDLSAWTLPGLSLMTRYVRGSQIDGSHAPATGAYAGQYGRGGRHWERDSELRYVVPSGPARDLSLSLAHVSHRGNSAQPGTDLDRLYLVIEWPFTGLF
ncbi:OprD family porin [Pseudomonas sp. SH1-B]